MTEDDVVKSQAFRAINLQIDQMAIELRAMMEGLQSKMSTLFREHKYPPSVRTRIHCEAPRTNGEYVPLPAQVEEIKDLQYYIDEIQRLNKSIGDLQRLKCRLTGDWDFTNGNLSDMIHVFGEKIEGM